MALCARLKAVGVPSKITCPPDAPRFWAQLDDPIGRPQHVHLVLDDDEAVALIDELLEHIKESPSIVAGGGPSSVPSTRMRAVSEVASKRPRYFTELEPLGLAPGEGVQGAGPRWR